MTTTAAQLDAFAALLGEQAQGYAFTVEVGKKNARIVQSPIFNGVPQEGSRSVYCFVRLEDGAILKAASWSATAKGVRAWLAEVMENPSRIGPMWLYR
jgi:hypothetical protein